MARELDILGIRLRTWIWALGCLTAAALLLRPDESSVHEAPLKGNQSDSKQVPALEHKPIQKYAASGVHEPGRLERAATLQLLSDPDPERRLEAAKKLDHLELGTGEVVAALTTCLRDTDANVRAHAVVRLGLMRLAAMDAVPVLKDMVQTDPVEQVRSHAKDALYNIRGYDYAPTAVELD